MDCFESKDMEIDQNIKNIIIEEFDDEDQL